MRHYTAKLASIAAHNIHTLELKLMRKIIFRGKSVYDGRWIFGDLSTTTDTGDKGASIEYYDEEDGWMCENVREETVGQFTGFCDWNGNEIYEGDLVVSPSYFGLVEWNKRGCFIIKNILCKDNDLSIGEILGELLDREQIDVVGNIHDNPRLEMKKNGYTVSLITMEPKVEVDQEKWEAYVKASPAERRKMKMSEIFPNLPK